MLVTPNRGQPSIFTWASLEGASVTTQIHDGLSEDPQLFWDHDAAQVDATPTVCGVAL